MTAKRRLFYLAAFALLAFLASRLVLWAFPSEADRLAERVEALGQRVLAGDFAAVLDHVDLDRFGFRAEAMGEVRTFGPEDAERLLARADDAASWLPLERATIDVVDASVGEGTEPDAADGASVAIRLSFTDEGQRYADTFDLSFRRSGDRWVMTGVRLRPPRDPARFGGALRSLP